MRHLPDNIAFELSNRCNYSHIHNRCPNNFKAEPVYLDTRIVTETVTYLGEVGLKSNIFLSVYNEPLIDPRLLWILQYINEHSDCAVEIFTNGWGLNQYLFNEMIKLRVTFTVSVYDVPEEERLRKINGMVHPHKVQQIILDPRVMQIYDEQPIHRGPCRFPSVYPMINHLGQMVLCCRDYKWDVIIADLNDISFEEALQSEKRLRLCDELESGERFLDICKRCSFVGWGIHQREWDKWNMENP